MKANSSAFAGIIGVVQQTMGELDGVKAQVKQLQPQRKNNR